MESRHRGGEDDRVRTPTADATAASSGYAAAGYHGSGIGLATAAAAASHPGDELWRREAKERIRERILREEAQALQALALEAEVRRELMEERFTLLRSGLARPVLNPRAEESEAKAAPAVGMIADSPSPIVVETQPKADVSASVPVKRKNTDHIVAGASAGTSTVSAATSSKKQRAPDLACTVCGITTTCEARMQDHLKGKTHRKKTAMLTPPWPVRVAKHGEHDENVILPKANGSAASLPRDNSDIVAAAVSTVPVAWSSKKEKLDFTCKVCSVTSTSEKAFQDHLRGKGHRKKVAAALALPAPALEHEEEGGYTPTKLNMATDGGAIHEVMQMNGYVLCKLCDVKTEDIITMKCHLQGSKHTSKYKVQQKQLKEAGNRPVPAAAAGGGEVKSSAADVDSSATLQGEEAKAAPPADRVKIQVEGRMCSTVVRQTDGTLSCELCGVHGCDKDGMLQHLYTMAHGDRAEEKAAPASS